MGCFLFSAFDAHLFLPFFFCSIAIKGRSGLMRRKDGNYYCTYFCLLFPLAAFYFSGETKRRSYMGLIQTAGEDCSLGIMRGFKVPVGIRSLVVLYLMFLFRIACVHCI